MAIETADELPIQRITAELNMAIETANELLIWRVTAQVLKEFKGPHLSKLMQYAEWMSTN